MEKNSNAVSDPQPIMFGWFIVLLIVAALAAVSAFDAQSVYRLAGNGFKRPDDWNGFAMSFSLTILVLLAAVKFFPVYRRRNMRGRQVLICKFRGSRETIGYFLPDGTQPLEFVRSLSGSVLRDGRYVTYWLGGWFKPSGRFVCIKSGRVIDQECRINLFGWTDRDFLRQQILVRDMLGNKVATSPGQLIMLAKAAGGTSFDWRDAPDRLAERLAAIDRIVEPRAGSRHTFS